MGEKPLQGGHQLAEKYSATSFLLLFPPNLDSVGKPVVFGLVRIFGPKSSVAQLAAMVVVLCGGG